MNRFEKHHRLAIDFGYSCFDRMVFNGYIPAFQHSACGGTIYWFLRRHRKAPPLGRAYFSKISRDYHDFVEQRASADGIDIITPDKGDRREELVEPFFQQLGARRGVAVILKAREAERIAWYFARTRRTSIERRYVDLYYFYLNDPQCGRMFLRICPYFPFNIKVWLNGHNWLACQLQRENIGFEKSDNLFTRCDNPQRLQELADAFSANDIVQRVESWLACLLPFFSDAERQNGYRHQLFMAEMEYCHNLLFHKHAALHRLFDRLLDANRSIGHPDKLAIVFGRPQFHPDTRTGRTRIKTSHQGTPVLSSMYQTTGIKQYVKHDVGLHGRGLRTESSSHQLRDLSIRKNLNNLNKLREVMDTANQRYLSVQQDVLASYVDRGQLEQLSRPSISATGRRVPGLHIDDPRLVATLNAILCFAYLVGKGLFHTRDLLGDVQRSLCNPHYTLSQLRYDLSKLRGKGLVLRVAGTQAYQVSSEGYRIAIFYLKLYQIYAPLTAAICDPVEADNSLLTHRQTKLDRLYGAVDKSLQKLATHLGMAA